MEEYKITEKDLMIGDWVAVTEINGKKVIGWQTIRIEPEHIWAIGQGKMKVMPVPLTGEILTKNGYRKTGNGDRGWGIEDREHTISRSYTVISINLGGELGYEIYDKGFEDPDEYWCGGEMDIDRCLSVHDLQHFYKLIGYQKDVII